MWGVSKHSFIRQGQFVTKRWDCERKYDEAWFVDKRTGEKKLAWTGICEFVGEPVEIAPSQGGS